MNYDNNLQYNDDTDDVLVNESVLSAVGKAITRKVSSKLAARAAAKAANKPIKAAAAAQKASNKTAKAATKTAAKEAAKTKKALDKVEFDRMATEAKRKATKRAMEDKEYINATQGGPVKRAAKAAGSKALSGAGTVVGGTVNTAKNVITTPFQPGGLKKTAGMVAGGALGYGMYKDPEGTKETAKHLWNIGKTGAAGLDTAATNAAKTANMTAATIDAGADAAGKTAAEVKDKIEDVKDGAQDLARAAEQRALRAKQAATRAATSASNYKNAIKNSSTGDKVRYGTAAALALATAGAIIAEVLKNRKAKLEGCDELEGESKEQCEKRVNTQIKSELKQKLGRCKHANDPAKCRSTIIAKIAELNK